VPSDLTTGGRDYQRIGFFRKAWPTARTAFGRPIFLRSTGRNGSLPRYRQGRLQNCHSKSVKIFAFVFIVLSSVYFTAKNFLARKRVWYFKPNDGFVTHAHQELEPSESWDSFMELRLPGMKFLLPVWPKKRPAGII